MRVAALGDGPAVDALAAGTLRGHQAQVTHELARVAASEAEAGRLHPVEGAGAMALKSVIPEADVAGGR